MTDRIDLVERTGDTTDAQAPDDHPDDWIWRYDTSPPTYDGTSRSSENPVGSMGDASGPNPSRTRHHILGHSSLLGVAVLALETVLAHPEFQTH